MAFSRDRAIPGWRLWTRLNHHRVPAYAVIFACVCALVMTLPVDVGRRATDVASVAGLMLGVGYMIGAVAPLVLGAARDVTGTFTTTLWLIVGSATVLFTLCASMTPERIARGVATPEPA